MFASWMLADSVTADYSSVSVPLAFLIEYVSYTAASEYKYDSRFIELT